MRFWINKYINPRLSKPFFRWYELGILGCGRSSEPWIDLAKFVPWPSNLRDIRDEILQEIRAKGHVAAGGHCLIPEHVNGVKFPTHYQFYWEDYISKDIAEQFNTKYEFDHYVYQNLSNPIWYSALNVVWHQDNVWGKKHLAGAQWNNMHQLPLLQMWLQEIEQSMFDSIGRVVIYSNLINSPVYIHRDYPVETESSQSHFVILQISSQNRKAFVYDEISDSKIYIGSSAYMFNELDCHGVDAEGEQNFTIRIDGTFKQSLCRELNFDQLNVFSNQSTNFNLLEKIKIY